MNVNCTSETCDYVLNAKCVFYEGVALPYAGISTNDNLQLVIQKLNDAIAGATTEVVWGTIIGNVTDQTDLINYLSSTYLTTATAASTYVPLGRILTINGTAFDLSANRTWNVGTVTTVAGTTDRITVTSPTTTPVIDIASTYVGQASITTLGTITTGTWNATVIGSNYGGAGAINGILKANGAGVVSAAVAGTDYLTPSGSGAGLSGVWLLASGGTLTGVNTITSNTANQLIFNGTWTATANNQYHTSFGGTLTSRNINNDILYGYSFTPQLTQNAGNPTGQVLIGIVIKPTFTVSSATTWAVELDNNVLISGTTNKLIRIFGSINLLNINVTSNSWALTNLAGYGISNSTTDTQFNSQGTISLRSQASVSNTFFFGDQSISPTTVRIFATILGAVQSVSTAYTPTSGTSGLIRIGGTNGFANFQPSSGTATHFVLRLNDLINQTGSASGTITDLLIDPSVTNVLGTKIAIDYNPTGSYTGSTHLAIRVVSGSVLFGGSTITAGSVLLDLQSTNTALVLTRVTNIASIVTPVNGMITYDAATNLFNFRQNGVWSLPLMLNVSNAMTGNTSITGAFNFEIGTSGSAVNNIRLDASSTIVLDASSSISLAAPNVSLTTSASITLASDIGISIPNSGTPPGVGIAGETILYSIDISALSELFVMNEAGVECQISTNIVAAPSTSVGAAITNYYGTAATNFLGDPVAWMVKKVGATTYKIPMYT